MHTSFIILISSFLAAEAAWSQQPQAAAAEAKLREGLRAATLQVRTLQGERDQLAIEKAALENEKTALAEKLEALTKEAAANQEAAAKVSAALETKLDARETENAQLSASLAIWQASQKEAVAVATERVLECSCWASTRG